MPTFYFDISDGDEQVRDDLGIELSDVQAARRQAISVLPDIARDELPDGDRREFRAVVRDASGKTVFKAKLSLVAEWVD